MSTWKRSDITQRMVLEVYARPIEQRVPVEEVLARETGAPWKVCWAAMERESSRGLVEYGTNLRTGWLTEAGRAKLKELQA